MEVESGESLVLSHPHHLYFPTDFTLPNFFINKQLKHAKFNLKIENNEYLLEGLITHIPLRKKASWRR